MYYSLQPNQRRKPVVGKKGGKELELSSPTYVTGTRDGAGDHPSSPMLQKKGSVSTLPSFHSIAAQYMYYERIL
tara:strand:+ start:877 stop:1098 length:222 start_codon:yes stop_codon:yes gene_type:complete